MPSVERWIVWSEDFARRHYDRNRQLRIEAAMAACRYYRDRRGMSRDYDLACADHYWLGRYYGFLALLPAAGAMALPVPSGRCRTAQQLVGDVMALLGWTAGALPVTGLIGVWDVAKRTGLADAIDAAIRAVTGAPPSPPASDPGPAQMAWAVAGYGHAGIMDLPFARDARPWIRLEEIEGMIIVPPPPH